MTRKLFCAILAVFMLIGVFTFSAAAQEDTVKFTATPPSVTTHGDEDLIPGRFGMTTWSTRSIAANYPNNAPADVDTVEEKVDWIAQTCREAGMTEEWDIAVWLHDWLIYNANYDYTFSYYHPEGVLLNGTGVCQSYAEAYELLLDEFGIENTVLSAYEMNHAWNLVKIDGEWCHVDCTWDDPGEGGYENHNYFGMTDTMISADHVWNTNNYVDCISKINYYPIRMGYLVCETEEEFFAILDEQAALRTEQFDIYYIGGDPYFSMATYFYDWYASNSSKYQIGGWGYTDYGTMLSLSVSYWGGHSHSYSAAVTDPTCTEQGYTTYTCSVCGDSYVDDYVDALGHDMSAWETVAEATCTEQGYTTYTCSVCGDSYVDDYVDALGHDMSAWETVAEATCTEDGSQRRDCKRCDYYETEVIKAPGHNHESMVTAPTCTEQGYTTHTCACGDSFVDTYVDALDHEMGNWVEIKAPTCNESGMQRTDCSRCDHFVEEVLSVIEHFYEDGICSVCGEKELLDSGTCDENLTWTLDTNGVLTISGTGALQYHNATMSPPWYDSRTSIKKVVIGDGVTRIGISAFSGCSRLASVTIGNGVTIIGWNAFSGCSALTSVAIPDSVTYIGYDAFSGCSSLTDVYITDLAAWCNISFDDSYYYSNPLRTNSLDKQMYLDGVLITDLVIPEGVTSIGDYEFYRCSSLTSVTIPDSVTYIGYDAFSGCSSLASVAIGNGVTSIGDYAFYSCDALESIVIPDNVTSFSNTAFRNCGALASVTIGNGVTSIGSEAFEGCSALTSVTIGNGVTSIGYRAFSGCSALTSVTIGNGVTSIGSSAFSGCSSLTSVAIGSGVTDIDNYAFRDCSSLTDVYITDLAAWFNISFYGSYSNPLRTNRLDKQMYLDGVLITDLVIPEGVTSISEYAFFNCSPMTSITIPDSVTSIGYNAFSGCSSLTSVVIPDSVTSISGDAFYGCNDILDVYYGGTAASWQALGNYRPDANYIHYSCTDPENHWKAEIADATCTEDGYTREACSCGYKRNEVIAPKLNHDMDTEWTITLEATCLENGNKRKDCSRCDHFETEVIEATGHKYESVVTEPTCTEQGYTTHTCECGDRFVDSYVDALGHKWDDGVITKEPTEDEDGTKLFTCERCGETKEETLPKLDHVHAHVSVVTEPTCTEKGYTTHTCKCGDSYVDSYVDALGHKWDDGVITKEPTEDEEGTKLFTCERCGETREETLPKLDHVHEYTSVVTEPTYTEQGYTTHTCSCGDSYVDSYVDPLPMPDAEVAVARMILGNELAMQFAFPKDKIAEGVDYVVSVTKTYADGRADKNILVPMDQWGTSGNYYYVSFNGIAAKEMGDEIHAQILTKDGMPVGDVYTDSVQNYAIRQLQKTTDAKTRTLYVDMLNYGAAAQTYFKYDAENLVTDELTEAEKGYGTKEVNLENNLVKGPGYGASQLNLASSIQLRVKFNGIDSSMYAIVKFTNHMGREIEARVEGSEFMYSGTVVVIDDVVAADYDRDVTITVYDADGNIVASAVESVASYIARMSGGAEIYSAVAKYCAAAYGYLHK